MPLNPNIILNPLQNSQQRFDNKLSNFVNRDDIKREKDQLFKLRDQKIAGNDATIGQAEDDRLNKSMVTAALRLKPLLNNPEQAVTFLEDRRNQILSRGGDPSDTDEAIADIRAGNLDKVSSDVDSLIGFGQQIGLLSAPKAEAKFTSTQVTDDGQLIGINRNTGTTAPIDIGDTRLKGSGTNVSITNAAESKGLTKEQEALANSRVKRFEDIQLGADNALDQDEQLAQLENLDIETGFGVETRGALASAVNAVFGTGAGDQLLDVNLPALQAFKGVSKRLVNSELNKAKGPQTEGDAKRAEQTIASLSNEKLANKFIIKSLRATNARKQEQAEFYQNILERDGTLKNADKEWIKFKRSTPMLSATALDSETGLPMFFNEFQAKVLERNPQATQDQIVKAWRDVQ